MKPSYRIAFYISGHGFGHATRSIAVIQALLNREPDLAFDVRTAVARVALARALGDTRLDITTVECDSGMVQLDSLRVDEAETLRVASRFYAQLRAKTEAEARYLTAAG